MNDIIKAILPWIGTALGGPLGGVAASAVGNALGLDNKTVDNVKNVLAGMNGEQLAALKQAELNVQVQLAQLGYQSIKDLEQLEVQGIEAVNTTMQVEAKAEHWPTYSWRPYNGFLFGTTIFCTYFLLPLFKIPVPSIPSEVWIAWGAILGVASYYRGKAQADINNPIPMKG